jgi:hypothetical protein
LKKCQMRRLSDYRVTISMSTNNMVTVPHKMVGLKRVPHHRGFTLTNIVTIKNINCIPFT